MDLDEDYRAIRWMQDNVQGSPVIVEANCPEYRWCTRFTIYTGPAGRGGLELAPAPAAHADAACWSRSASRKSDSSTARTDAQEAADFLRRYNVRYIVVGQLERAEYPGGWPGEVRGV